ncbi:MAG: hypothetical protein SVU32_07335 [Candidatus Nanohaloarchaea archaeon]|nr:hypothetical protein [Candidatus Nanohaloarchaea archaeon]
MGDDDLFGGEELDGMPDDVRIEHMETKLYRKWDKYEEHVDEFMDEVHAFIDEQDQVYDIRFETSYTDGSSVLKTAWIYYGDGDG